jgi:AMMECR1 domain-containing protein
LDEIRILREFVDRYGTPHAIAVDEAARNFMSLCNDDRHGGIVDKGERVGWLLWDVGIEMPRYQPAILRLVEAI